MSESRSIDTSVEEMGLVRRCAPYLLLVTGALLFGGGLRYHLHFRDVPSAGGMLGSGIAWLHGAFGLFPLLALSALLVGWSASMIQPGRLRFERSWTFAYAIIFVCFASGLAGIWDGGGTLGHIIGGGVREVVGAIVAVGLLGAGAWLSLGLATDRWSFGRARLEEDLDEAFRTVARDGVASSLADGMMPPRTGAETAPQPAQAHGTAALEIPQAAVAPSEEHVANTLQHIATGSLHGSDEDAAIAVLDAPVFDAPVARIDDREPLGIDSDRLADQATFDPECFIPELVVENETEFAAPDLNVFETSAKPVIEPLMAAGDDDEEDIDDDDEEEEDEEEEDWDDDEDDDWDDDDEEEEEDEEEEDSEEGTWDDSDDVDADADADADGDDDEDDEDWDDDDDDDDDDDEDDEDEDEDDDDDDDDWEDGDGDEEWNAAPDAPKYDTELAPAARRGGSPAPQITPDAPGIAAASGAEETADFVLRPAAKLNSPDAAATTDATPSEARPRGASILSTADPRFERAVELVLGCQRAAPSLLQRRMMLDFPTASRFLEFMEAEGLVGPSRGGLDREIRVSLEAYREARG